MNDDLEPILSGEEILPDSTNTTLTTVPPEAPTEPYEVTTGLDVPAQAIEKGTLNLGVITAKIQNFALDDFFVVDEADTSELADAKREMLAGLRIDNEVDNSVTRIEKMLNLLILSFNDGIGKFYGTPIERFQSTRKFEPQVTIIFKELTINDQDLPLRNYYLEKEVSIKILRENIPKSEDELEELRVKIVDAFGGFTYTSSKTNVYTYRDKQDGLYFSIAADREIAKTIIEKALSIQEMQYSDRILVEKVYPENQPSKIDVLGKQVDEPNQGRWGEVRFNRIEYKQGGIVDRILRP
jgi:hypothetical protein